MRRGRVVVMLAAVAVTAACTGGDGDDRAGDDVSSSRMSTIPLFDSTLIEGPCPVEVEQPERVTCGTVTVPERHADPRGRTIELAVAVIAPDDRDPAPDPLFLLQGGPGSGFVDSLPFLLDEPIVGDRAMVLFDPRGTGHSEPFLGCPEVEEADVARLALDPDDPASRRLRHDAVVACRARLVADDLDLGAYSYAEIATDIAVIRGALGYDEWNLYGISNGGRMALEVLRRHPEGVRSVVLDAPVSPQGSLPGERWPHAQRAFEALYAGCAADARCASAHPDLAVTASTLIARLAEDPVVVEVDRGDGEPAAEVRVDEELAAEALRRALYDAALIPLLPQYIDRLSRGDAYVEVASLFVGLPPDPRSFSHGMSFSVSCQEEIAFLDAAFFAEQAEDLPELASVIEDPVDLDDCAVWDVGQADPSIEEPVESDVPTLVLVGEYDPVHPLESSQAIASTLEHAQVFELPGLGHGVVRVHPCGLAMARAFVDDPDRAVDARCIEEMPDPAWAG